MTHGRDLAACAFSVLLSAAVTSGADWPYWRGPNQDGTSPETGWRSDWKANSPAVLWKASVGGREHRDKRDSADVQAATCAVVQGRLFTYSESARDDDPRQHDFTLICLDALTGKELWRHSVATDASWIRYFPHAPVAEANVVYLHSPSALVECLDAASGKVVWSSDLRRTAGGQTYRTRDGNRGSPVIVGDLFCVDVRGR